MKILDKVMQDELFGRLMFLVWAILSAVMLCFLIFRKGILEQEPLFLVIPALVFALFIFCLYMSFMTKHNPDKWQNVISAPFWVFIIVSALLTYPFYVVLKLVGKYK